MGKSVSEKACCVPAIAKSAPNVSQSNVTLSEDARNSWRARAVTIPGGDSTIGTDNPYFTVDAEGPKRTTELAPFLIDPWTVTNRWFGEFITATGYLTDAERYGWSLVFWALTDPKGSYRRVAHTPWWCMVEGARWDRPNGPDSDIEGLNDHPVTHVSWNDAMAFAKWAGGTLPDEAQWEHAARGGNPAATYPWGDQEPTDEAPLCNIWQGRFPEENTCIDGYMATAPVDSFQANPFGLYNMAGNVWEWCRPAKESVITASMDPNDPPQLLKGGSFMCHKSYCYRYRIAARTFAGASTTSSHTGFRIVGSVG